VYINIMPKVSGITGLYSEGAVGTSKGAQTTTRMKRERKSVPVVAYIGRRK